MATRSLVVNAWRQAAETLRRQGDAHLASQVERFVRGLPPAATDREHLKARLLLHLNERRRATANVERAVEKAGQGASISDEALKRVRTDHLADHNGQTAASGQKQVLATVRSSAAEIHCRKGEATQIGWQDAAGWPTLVFHPP